MITILFERLLPFLLIFSLISNASAISASQIDYDTAGTLHKVPISLEAEAPLFSVSVPTNLPTYLYADGSVEVADNVTITNNSNKAIQVTDIEITPASGWNLVPYDSNIGANEFALSINDVTSGEGTFEWNNFKLEKEEVLPLDYSIQTPDLSEGLAYTEIASLSLMLDWYKPTYAITAPETGQTLYDGSTVVNLGDTIQLQAAQTFSLRTPTWESSDPSKATVDNTGLVTPIEPGDFTITYGEAEFPMRVYGRPVAASTSNTNMTDSQVIIPAHYYSGGVWYTVTSIAASGFKNRTDSKSITIPDTVTSIGSDAFYGCSKFAITELPDSITSIASGAFSGVKSINRDIPSRVQTIGANAFQGVDFGANILTLPASLVSLGSGAFKTCKFSGIKVYSTAVIPDACFENLNSPGSIWRIWLPKYLLGIYDTAFKGINVSVNILYESTAEQWSVIPIHSGSIYVNKAPKQYNVSY